MSTLEILCIIMICLNIVIALLLILPIITIIRNIYLKHKVKKMIMSQNNFLLKTLERTKYFKSQSEKNYKDTEITFDDFINQLVNDLKAQHDKDNNNVDNANNSSNSSDNSTNSSNNPDS